jgi:hypothetical protein
MSEEKNGVAESKAVALYHGDVAAEAPALLARLQESKAVRIVADRIVQTDPAKDPVNHGEALLVAQAAMATGLSPFPPQPELVWWINKVGNRRVMTMMRGRDGTARLAQENVRRTGTYLMPPRFELVTDGPLLKSMGFNTDDLVVRCRISTKRDVDDYYESRATLKAEGLPFEEIDRRLGDLEPASEGYGRMTKEEMDLIDTPRWYHKCQKQRELNTSWGKRVLRGFDPCPDCDETSSAAPPKWSHISKTRKRAKVEAEKPWAADISPQALAAGSSSDLDAYSIDAEWREIDVEKLSPEELARRKTEGKDASDAIFGNGTSTPPKPREPEAKAPPKPTVRVPRPAVQVQAAFVERIGAKGYKGLRRNASLEKVVGTHLSTVFNGDDDARHACQMYLTGKPSLTDFSGAELKALLDMLEIHPQNGGHAPSVAAAQEMKNCAMSLQAEGA